MRGAGGFRSLSFGQLGSRKISDEFDPDWKGGTLDAMLGQERISSPLWTMVLSLGAGAFVVFAGLQGGFAANLTATATAVIDGETGAVGEEESTTTTTTTTTAPAANENPTDGTLRTDPLPAPVPGGLVRPAPQVAPPAPAPAVAAADGSPANQVPTATRLPSGSQKVGNLLGGSGAVAVAGQPNQTFTVSLPGKTVYSTGSSIVTIDSFVHNAGFTPALNTLGGGVFQMGAQVGNGPGPGQTAAGQSGGQGSAGSGPAASGADGPALGPVREPYGGPVIAISPFINITISYN